jgi:hypothetical protein
MPYNPKTHHRITVDIPMPFYKRLLSLSKKLDRTILDVSKGIIVSALTTDKEYDRVGKK